MAGYLGSYLKLLDDAFHDERVIEIAVNADGRVWVEKAGSVGMESVEGMNLSASEVGDLAHQIANTSGNQFGDKAPILSASIDYEGLALRAQAVTVPALDAGTILAFRVFRARQRSAPKKFVVLRSDARRSLEEERQDRLKGIVDSVGTDVDAFLKGLIERKVNVVVSGGTSTGKTELGRKLLSFVPDEERIITIEDSLELLPTQPNAVSLVAQRDDKSPRSAGRLLQSCLRMRPDRIILGELRGEEAVTFLDAINTGHGGSFTTLHAESARKAMDRLALLVLGAGSRLSYPEVMRYLQGSIDVIVQMGRVGSQRGIMEVYAPVLEKL